MIICYTVPYIWHVTHLIIFYFGLFFNPFTPITARKEKKKLEKVKKKKTWRYHRFTYEHQKL